MEIISYVNLYYANKSVLETTIRYGWTSKNKLVLTITVYLTYPQ